MTQTVDSDKAVRLGSQRPEAPEPSAYLTGEVIGDRYRLERELGRGGMGVVWVAHSLVLGIDVALKLIRAGVAAPAVASRMAREAHAAARLGHPALVRVFDFGWTGRGDPFLVMELVQGETLSEVICRERQIPVIRAAQILLPIADGLRIAHDRSIVHRDIKPDNILLATDSLGRLQPKLLDFGIAKVGPAVSEGKLTQYGTVLGSPEYMSPEQALGLDDIDERTDVWSFCCALYEMVTGTIPFEKSNYNALMHAIISEEPRSTVSQGVGDASFWEILEKGMAKEREKRFRNMTELGEALALWLYEHGIKADLCGNSLRAVWLDGSPVGLLPAVELTIPPGRNTTPSLSHAVAPRVSRSVSLLGQKPLSMPPVWLPHNKASRQLLRKLSWGFGTLSLLGLGWLLGARNAGTGTSHAAVEASAMAVKAPEPRTARHDLRESTASLTAPATSDAFPPKQPSSPVTQPAETSGSATSSAARATPIPSSSARKAAPQSTNRRPRSERLSRDFGF